KSTRAGRRLLFQVHALGPFASRADDDAVHSSREEHERGKAGAVVIHGNAQFLDAVVDSSELDTSQFGHLSHLPLHDLAEGVLRAVHMAFRDVATEAVVPESVCDAGRDRLAFPAPLLREDAMRDG